ncbi:MAG: hypothetical protein J7555_07025, partial [Chloroflexi bacterium]|nr:hypothetical protein [Chloroflexota bacterium]
PACGGGANRQRMGERINEFEPRMADRGVDGGRWWGMLSSLWGRGKPSTNGGTNKRIRAADGRPRSGWWTVVGDAFQPVGEGQTVNEWGNE